MATSLIGRIQDSLPPNFESLCPRYYEMLVNWQDRATKYVRKNIGYMDGLLVHYWHGNKKDRRYVDRWKILLEEQYDPIDDLKKDWQGLWQLTDRSVQLRDRIRAYFRQRNEDSIDVV
jgi:hypothetical protein